HKERTPAAQGILKCVAAEYKSDARRGHLRMWILYGATIMLVGGSVSLALVEAGRASSRTKFAGAQFAAYGLISLVILLLAVYLGHQATRQRIWAAESSRVARQLLGFDAYVEPLPQIAQDLFRGTMIPRLFPRVLEDDDPLR